MFKKMMVPLDGSQLAEQAIPPAVTIAQATNAELVFMRVVVPLEVIAPFIEIQPAYDTALNRQEAESRDYLEQLRQKWQTPDMPIHIETRMGMVAETIVDCAAEHGVDLIVICSHGRTGLTRWVYGSVAEKVVRGAQCDTLIVRGRLRD
ncbi:MAG: universal stress protein [Anaerolineales bacterium]|nr:universal stress protein [Anaerolineales bacterium]MCB8954692.1 universal stress protein [Ardenticatenales bacterium]